MPERGAKTRDPSERGFGGVALLALSMLLSALVAAVTVLAIGRARSPRQASGLGWGAGAGAVSGASRGSGGEVIRPAERVERVRVPNLVGAPLENVRTIVESLRLLLVVRVPREPGALPDGTVSAQAPSPGTELLPGAQLAVVVSAGPRPPWVGADGGAPPDGDVDLVVVPAVRSLPLGVARARLAQVGLTEGPRRYLFDEYVSPGRVLGQSPPAGARVPRGSSVRLSINRE
jgi:hypothetical protein